MRSSLAYCLVPLALMISSCAIRRNSQAANENELQSEVDSFTPRVEPIDPAVIAGTLDRLDVITNAYLKDAVAWANREPECNGYCMAMLVSETLAATQSHAAVSSKLADIRAGKPYGRWGRLPPVPGWRGFRGEIEHLLSKGRTQDNRYTIDDGIIRLPLTGSVFKTISRLDSPGSFLEVGAILPIDLTPNGLRVFIGSDKFGHFLSTGFEYLEAYLETYDETVAKGLSADAAREHAEFAMYIRGLLTEVTSLGGWLARVFSYADLSANHDGYLFFSEIYSNRSPYLKQNSQTKKWQLTSRPFSWRDFVDPAWDEALNCSHYFASVTGTNTFQKKIVRELVDLKAEHQQRFICPVDVEVCKTMVQTTEKQFSTSSASALISPQCIDVATGKRSLIELTEADAEKDAKQLDAIGFYSGEFIVTRSQQWCRKERDRLVAARCAKQPLAGMSAGDCVKKIERVSSENFRCELDATDFLGWSF